MLGLSATFHPFMGFPSFKAISHLPLAEQVRRMRDPALKARMITEKSEPVSGDGSPLPPLADFFLANIDMVALRLFRLGEEPNYEPSITESLGTEAMVRGIPVLSVLYDAMLEDEGRALTYFPVYNYAGMNLDVVHEMLTHPLALPGLSDGGAHGHHLRCELPDLLDDPLGPRPRERTHPSRACRPDAESRHGTVCGLARPRRACTSGSGQTSTSSTSRACSSATRSWSPICRRAASGSSSGRRGTSPPWSRERSSHRRGQITSARPGRLVRSGRHGSASR